MKFCRAFLSLFMVAVLLAGFVLVPGSVMAEGVLPPGDINGDGKVNLGDVTRIYAHIRNVRLITDEAALRRADLSGDGKLNIGDVARAYTEVRSGEQPKTNVTLKVWTPSWDQDGDSSWLSRMQKSFEASHPRYNITWVNEVCSEGDAGSFVSNDPENAADVYMYANDQIGLLRYAGALYALEGQYRDQVLGDNAQTLVDTVTYTDGQIYGFPIANNTWFMYYNKDVFTEEDVKSLDTMLTKGTVAFPWGTAWYSGTFFLANGGQLFGEQGNDASAGIQFGADNGGCEAALKMIQLANNPCLLNDYSGLGIAGLKDGTIGAAFSGSWDAAGLRESMGDRLGVAALPTVEIGGEQKQMKAFAGSKVVGVNPYAEDPQLALEFAAHLASVEGQKLRYELRGIIPAAKTLVNDPAVSSGSVAVAEMNTMTYASVKQPIIPEMSNYWTPMGNFSDGIVNGEITEDNYLEYLDQLMAALNGNEQADDSIPVTLKVWTPAEDQYDDTNSWLKQMQQSFEELYPQYDITWINEVCYPGDAASMILDEPDTAADVYLFANDQIGVLREAGAIGELYDEYALQVLADNAQVLVDTVTYTGGSIYGFPISNNTWFMYYNKDVFTEEDVKSLDTMLTKGTVAFPWENGWYSGTFFLANGGQIFGEQGNDAYAGIQFGAENGGHEAALKMVQLANHPNLKTDENGLGVAGLIDRSIGAYFSGSWDYNYLKENLGDDLGVVALPTVEIGGEQKQMKSFAGSTAVGVNPNASNYWVAMDFAAHLASVEGQKLRYELRDIIPAAKELANDPAISSDPVAVAEMNTMLNAAVVQPTIPEMGNYWSPMGTFGYLIANGYVTEDNYIEQVDQLMYELNTYDIYEPEDPDEPDDLYELELPEWPEGSDELLPPPSGGTPVTLKVWTPWGDQMTDRNWLVRMENQFQQAHPEYSITWINEVCGEGDAGSIVSNDPEAAADVYMYANDQIATLTSSNALTALDGAYLEQVLSDNGQTLVNTVTCTNGQVYGFPISNNTWFMYYNKDTFTEEDVKSLDTMLTKGTVAFPWEISWYSGTFFLANGGQLFGEQGSDASAGIQFGAENGGYEAALKMVQLANNPHLLNDYSGLGIAGLRDGSVDAIFSGSWDYEGLYGALGDKLGAVQLPTVEIGGQQKQLKAFAGSKAVGVNPNADNQELALEFAAQLASVESQKLRYQARMVIPAAKELINDPIVSSNPAAVAEMNTMTYASVKQPTIPEMGNYWMPMGDFGFAISNGEVTEDNYQEYVDFLMMNFGYEETEAGFQITDVQSTIADAGDITLRFHYYRPDGDYAGWNLWLWNDSTMSKTELDPPYEFEWIDGEMICTVKVAPETSEVGYVVRYLDWVDKDIHEDRFVDLYDVCGGTVDIYIESGEPWYYVDYQDVIWGVGFAYLDYNRVNSRLVLGLTAACDDLCPVLSTGSKTIDIIKETAVGYNYFLTLEQPLEPGHYTLTTDSLIVSFDII